MYQTYHGVIRNSLRSYFMWYCTTGVFLVFFQQRNLGHQRKKSAAFYFLWGNPIFHFSHFGMKWKRFLKRFFTCWKRYEIKTAQRESANCVNDSSLQPKMYWLVRTQPRTSKARQAGMDYWLIGIISIIWRKNVTNISYAIIHFVQKYTETL
jgi:hypothetical protein